MQHLIEKQGSPSVKTVERFLKAFHEDQARPEGVNAWVPSESEALKNLAAVNRAVTRRLIEKSSLSTVTIENDATLIFSQKQAALRTYKGGTGYAPVLGSIAELGLILADEFRDGNVPAAFEVTGFFKEYWKALPATVKTIRARLDGAYDNLEELIPYLKEEKIQFTITGKKSKSMVEWIEALPESSWKPLKRMTEKGWEETGREWTEMFWTSAEGSQASMSERSLRYLLTRKREQQWELFERSFQKR